ncbi:MAG: hypothetical protein KF874_13245 [Rhizobiaceae bacterium]|nr:hypothetical protein [Rhizobiaceae bacterium]
MIRVKKANQLRPLADYQANANHLSEKQRRHDAKHRALINLSELELAQPLAK